MAHKYGAWIVDHKYGAWMMNERSCGAPKPATHETLYHADEAANSEYAAIHERAKRDALAFFESERPRDADLLASVIASAVSAELETERLRLRESFNRQHGELAERLNRECNTLILAERSARERAEERGLELCDEIDTYERLTYGLLPCDHFECYRRDHGDDKSSCVLCEVESLKRERITEEALRTELHRAWNAGELIAPVPEIVIRLILAARGDRKELADG